MKASDVILVWIFPLVGGIVGTIMFAAPIKAVLRASQENDLGSLNPLPFPAQVANTIGWIAYTYVLAATDLQASAVIYWVNHVGLMLGLFYTLTTYGLANAKTRKIQLAVFLFFASVLSLLGAVGTMTRMSNDHLKLLWGFSTNAILLMYYAAPLSTVYLVIKTRSAATLHAPLVIMQCVNGALWFGYGMAISDPFVWVPNGIGSLFGGFCFFLLIIFRRPKTVPDEESHSDEAIIEKQPTLRKLFYPKP